MPAFGRDELLTKDQIAQVAKFVQTLSSGKPDAAGPGAALYKEHCAACHGDSGQGDREQGAAKLSDQIWLYGGDLDTITKTITNSRNGVMPAWAHRLDDVTIKQLAIYVHTLGGGE